MHRSYFLLRTTVNLIIREITRFGMWLKVVMMQCILLTIIIRYDEQQNGKKTYLPNKTIIRSIYVDGDKIYSGSTKSLGIGFKKMGE
jgi:hypothetical protein